VGGGGGLQITESLYSHKAGKPGGGRKAKEGTVVATMKRKGAQKNSAWESGTESGEGTCRGSPPVIGGKKTPWHKCRLKKNLMEEVDDEPPPPKKKTRNPAFALRFEEKKGI